MAAEPLNLDGIWQVQLVECFQTESDCRHRLAQLNDQRKDFSGESSNHRNVFSSTFSVQIPSNLRSVVPWFHGYAEFSREFQGSELSDKEDESDLLILGSIGSVDRVYLNGKFIGFEGNYEPGMILPLWNKVRAYHIPTGVLLREKNVIRVGVWITDVKAGIHAGPLLLGNSRALIPGLYTQRLLREYIFTAIPFLLVIVIIVILITFPYWQPAEGHLYLLFAFAGYFIHSLYYAGIPWPWDHLTFLKIHWSGRLVSAWLTIPYFLRNFGIRSREHEIFILTILAIMILITISAESYTAFFSIAVYLQGFMFLQPFYPVIFRSSITEERRKKMFSSYLLMVPPVMLTYLNDLLIRMYEINFWWLYHYLSILNIINFLYHYAYHLYMWRDFGHEQGRRAAEVRYLKEKLKMANELHDLVGSELAQVVVLSNNVSTGSPGQLHELAESSLEKVRSFARILKNEEKVGDLPTILKKIYLRLLNLKRFKLHLSENETVSFSGEIILQARKKQFASGKSEISSYTRLQIDRILSEWMANIIRHAKPDKIILGFRNYSDHVSVFVYQSNNTFSWNGKSATGGLGSISRRVKEFSGKVICRPYRDGAVFILKVPFSSVEYQHRL